MSSEERSPDRIEPILSVLREAWHTHPNQRLCQLIVNAVGLNDPFYVEDYDARQSLAVYARLVRAEKGERDG